MRGRFGKYCRHCRWSSHRVPEDRPTSLFQHLGWDDRFLGVAIQQAITSNA